LSIFAHLPFGAPLTRCARNAAHSNTLPLAQTNTPTTPPCRDWRSVAMGLLPTEALTHRIAELEARVGQPPKTPDNSSVPLSQGREASRAERRAAKKRKGRPGVFRALADNPDRIVESLAERCPHCAHELRPDVPATNNDCERALRPSVIFRKVTSGFRSQWGAHAYAAAASVIATGRLHGLSALQALQAALAGRPVFMPP
jgi:Transposase IS66 family